MMKNRLYLPKEFITLSILSWQFADIIEKAEFGTIV